MTGLSKPYFRFRRFTLMVQMKKLICLSYNSSTSSWKLWRWVRLDLIFTIRFSRSAHLRIYLSLETLTSIIRSERSILAELIELTVTCFYWLSLNSKVDATFHCRVFNYSRADWASLLDHLKYFIDLWTWYFRWCCIILWVAPG